MSGYSSTPLVKKLGIKSEQSKLIIRAPSEYCRTVGLKSIASVPKEEAVDFVHAFYAERAELEADAPELVWLTKRGGMLWISWPKKSARKVQPSDISEQDLRDIFLPLGVVDVKVCAVTDVWSGLKFVWRKNNLD